MIIKKKNKRNILFFVITLSIAVCVYLFSVIRSYYDHINPKPIEVVDKSITYSRKQLLANPLPVIKEVVTLKKENTHVAGKKIYINIK